MPFLPQYSRICVQKLLASRQPTDRSDLGELEVCWANEGDAYETGSHPALIAAGGLPVFLNQVLYHSSCYRK